MRPSVSILWDVKATWPSSSRSFIHQLSRITSYNVCYTKLLRQPVDVEELDEADEELEELDEIEEADEIEELEDVV